VIGLTRSETGAQSLIAARAEVHRGTLEDLESLRSGAAKADGVIHCAFDHDFSNFVANCEKDGRAIEALGDALAGSNRPLVITSGTRMGSRGPGELATEDNFDEQHLNPRKASEYASVYIDKGLNRWPAAHVLDVAPLYRLALEKAQPGSQHRAHKLANRLDGNRLGQG
jgi:uncharacterized protein YbjT (DUF2867 family)